MSASSSLNNGNVIGGDVKQAKFDRQLRLWGVDGQAMLEAAHIVALGATPAIAEALKSLILAGVRVVTLADERMATVEDTSANYFVPASSAGAPLATAVLKNVCSLGEQCIGVPAIVAPDTWINGYVDAVEQDWQTGCLHRNLFIPNTRASTSFAFCGAPLHASKEKETEDVSALKKFLNRFPAVVGLDSNRSSSKSPPLSGLGEASVHVQISAPSLILVSERYADLSSTSALVQTCLQKCYPDVPVVLVRSSGFLGFVQVYCPRRIILSPHNPSQVKMEDLRIFEPFPALRSWFDAHNPDDVVQFPTNDLDSMALHSHLPYPCILHHAFHRWWSSLSSEEQARRQENTSVSSYTATHTTSSIFPLSAKDYHDIASVVAGMIRRQSPPEDAFIEAMEKCTAKLNRPVVQRLPEGLNELLQDPRCADPSLAAAELKARLFPAGQDAEFFSATHPRCATAAGPLHLSALLLWTRQEVLVWFVLRAVALFVRGEIGGEAEAAEAATTTKSLMSKPGVSLHHLPFSGYLPDFTTTTMWYRELQHIYHSKHLEDVACIAEKAWELVVCAAATTIKAPATITHNAVDKEQQNTATDVAHLEQQLRPLVRSLLIKYTTMMVENIWDLRMVSFSSDYLAVQVPEWRQRLGQRLTWIAENITYDVQSNANARRAACLAVAHLCKEELQRSAAAAAAPATHLTELSQINGETIAREATQLLSLGKATSSGQPNSTAAESAGIFAKRCVEDDGPPKLFRKACEEVARWTRSSGGALCVQQLPSVAASTGALAAQEAVKLIMRIYVPCGQPMMYDGYTNKVYTL